MQQFPPTKLSNSVQDSLHPTVMEVDLERLVENFKTIKNLVSTAEVMCVVKADAYGHGLERCALSLEAAGASQFGVAFVLEGIRLRAAGVRSRILVFGGILGNQIEHFLRHDLELTASSVGKLEQVEAVALKSGVRAKVHLKVDTGMERIGVHYYSADALFQKAAECKHVDVVGVFSHFAEAEQKDCAFTKLQLERFQEVVARNKKSIPATAKSHIANSAGALFHPEARLDLVRVGLGLYGINPNGARPMPVELKPAMRWVSRVVYFKVVKKGATVSYGRTWTAKHDTRVVTVPVGYGDGYFRQLSNCGQVLIRGKRYPVIGKVCMDQIMVDIGPDGEAYNGDEVVLLGEQGGECITANEVANLIDTAPHHVLTALNSRIPRAYMVDIAASK